MPICKKCNKDFGLKQLVNGKLKQISNRRLYCLECSPYNSHNTKPIHLLDYTKARNCDRCQKQYDPAVQVSSTMKFCAACSVALSREKRKKALIDLKGGKCIVCQYDRCMRCLEFHHLDQSKKDFGISLAINSSFEKIKKEVEKCALLCNRCHGEVHAGLIDLNNYLDKNLLIE